MEICKMFGNIKDFFNLIDNAVILINIEGQILYINNRAEEILRLDNNCINKYIKDNCAQHNPPKFTTFKELVI